MPNMHAERTKHKIFKQIARTTTTKSATSHFKYRIRKEKIIKLPLNSLNQAQQFQTWKKEGKSNFSITLNLTVNKIVP